MQKLAEPLVVKSQAHILAVVGFTWPCSTWTRGAQRAHFAERICGALPLLRVWCLRSTPHVQRQRALLDTCNKGRGTLPPHQDDAIDKTPAIQGPRSACQTSSETADAHRSRFTSGCFRALQSSPAELFCQEMPWPWDSIRASRCCRDLRNGLNHFARPSGASEP